MTFFLAKLCDRDIKKGVIPMSLKRYVFSRPSCIAPTSYCHSLTSKQEVKNLNRDLTAVPSLSVYTSQQRKLMYLMEPPIGTWMRPADLLHLLCRWNLRRATTFYPYFGIMAPAKGTPHSKEIPQTPVLPRLLRIKVASLM